MNHSLTITPHGLIMRDVLPSAGAALEYVQAQSGGDVTVAQLGTDMQVWSLDDDHDLPNLFATRMAESFAELSALLYGPCTFTAAHDPQGNIRGLDVAVTRQLIQLYDALTDDDHVESLHHRDHPTPHHREEAVLR